MFQNTIIVLTTCGLNLKIWRWVPASKTIRAGDVIGQDGFESGEVRYVFDEDRLNRRIQDMISVKLVDWRNIRRAGWGCGNCLVVGDVSGEYEVTVRWFKNFRFFISLTRRQWWSRLISFSRFRCAWQN